MRVVQINGGVFGSTGKIMFGIADALIKSGNETLCFSPVTTTNRNNQPDKKYIKIGSFQSRRFNVLLGRITGFEGCFAYFATKRMLKKISEFKPDVIHLHTLHGSFVNLPLLFRYIKKNKIKAVWTLHDCWSFTGHCPHFVLQNCEKWKECCGKCPSYREYPQSLFDNSKKMHRLKRKWFSGIADCTVVTPSKWLADLAEKSFLSQYPVMVINNGINLSVFHPIQSDFRKNNGLEDKIIILGVSFGWSNKKGLDVFISLAKELSEDYRIVLVGTDKNTDRVLPESIISIHRTQNQTELAQIYSAADVFVNPTREDNFPTVNIEALACGTPVITFDTGGSSEIIDDTSGASVPEGDIKAILQILSRVKNDNCFSADNCIKRAEKFSSKDKFEEYIRIY